MKFDIIRLIDFHLNILNLMKTFATSLCMPVTLFRLAGA